MIKLYRREKPEFYGRPPDKRTTLIKKAEIQEDEKFDIPQGAKWMFISYIREAERGYGYGPSRAYAEIEFHGDEQDNPNLQEETEEYTADWNYYLLQVAEWENEMSEISKKEEEQNKKLLAELKAKYE